MTALVIVGGGRMGEALLGGLLTAGWDGSEVSVVEPVEGRRAELARTPRFQAVTISADPIAADGAVIAVKPGDVPAAVTATVDAGARRILSIAAGVTVATLETAAGAGVAVVRAMPNTPALIAEGAAAIAGGSSAAEADMRWARSILEPVGTVVEVPEHLLDAVTGLSGSGPAYVYLVAEAMIEAGVLVGLPRDVAVDLALQTLSGAAQMARGSRLSPEALRAMVTSPGGTTAAGLAELERHGVRAAFLDAVVAATKRSKELGA